MLEIAPILTDIVLSMDSLDETDAVQLRGDEKCVAEAVSALDACKQAGVPVKVISVCASVNRQSLPELGEYLSSRGIEDWWIQQFIPQGRGRSLQGKYDMDSSLFEETVESLKATFAGTIRAFPAVGKNRHRVYVDCRGSFVEYDSGRELGRVLDPETRRAVFSDASYGNKRRS